MNDPEKRFWKWLRTNMGGIWHAQRHEDKYSVGIPDVSYAMAGVDGWIELKAYEKWPTKDLPHFTSKQVNWLSDRGSQGNGHCYLLIKVKKTILLISWEQARKVYEDTCNEETLRWLALKVWNNGFKISEFTELLTTDRR